MATGVSVHHALRACAIEKRARGSGACDHLLSREMHLEWPPVAPDAELGPLFKREAGFTDLILGYGARRHLFPCPLGRQVVRLWVQLTYPVPQRSLIRSIERRQA